MKETVLRSGQSDIYYRVVGEGRTVMLVHGFWRRWPDLGLPRLSTWREIHHPRPTRQRTVDYGRSRERKMNPVLAMAIRLPLPTPADERQQLCYRILFSNNPGGTSLHGSTIFCPCSFQETGLFRICSSTVLHYPDKHG